jgi:hypothetical protein
MRDEASDKYVPDYMKIDKQVEEIQLHSKCLTVREFAALYVGLSLDGLAYYDEFGSWYQHGISSFDNGASKAQEKFLAMMQLLHASITERVEPLPAQAVPAPPVFADGDDVPF